MFLYAVGTLPLIQSLKGSSSCVQVWYADDASACGSLSDLHQWFELLLSKDPDFGYVVNPAKCCLVIHDSYKSNAEQLFSSLGVSVVCNHRYLGGFIGELTGQASLFGIKYTIRLLMYSAFLRLLRSSLRQHLQH